MNNRTSHEIKTEKNKALITAAKENNLTRVKQLVASGADVNYIPYSTAPYSDKVCKLDTALVIAIKNENISLIRYLVSEANASLSITCGYYKDMTPLEHAFTNKKIASLSILLELTSTNEPHLIMSLLTPLCNPAYTRYDFIGCLVKCTNPQNIEQMICIALNIPRECNLTSRFVTYLNKINAGNADRLAVFAALAKNTNDLNIEFILESVLTVYATVDKNLLLCDFILALQAHQQNFTVDTRSILINLIKNTLRLDVKHLKHSLYDSLRLMTDKNLQAAFCQAAVSENQDNPLSAIFYIKCGNFKCSKQKGTLKLVNDLIPSQPKIVDHGISVNNNEDKKPVPGAPPLHELEPQPRPVAPSLDVVDIIVPLDEAYLEPPVLKDNDSQSYASAPPVTDENVSLFTMFVRAPENRVDDGHQQYSPGSRNHH